MNYLGFIPYRIFLSFFMIVTICLSFGCSSQKNISYSGDFHQLDELTRFEYEYSLNEALKYKLLGDYKRAVYFFNRCIELFPESHVAYYELSNIYFSHDETELSVKYGQKALDLETGNIWYYIQLGQIYYENEDFEESYNVYGQAINKFEDNLQLKFTLASMFTQQGEYKNAIHLYNELESIIGVDERVYLPLQLIYSEKGEFENAYNILNKLILAFPEEPRFYGILAELYTSIGMYDKALETYDELFAVDPDNGNAQLSIAEYFLHQGQSGKAYVYLQAAFNNYRVSFNEKIQVYNFVIAGDDSYGFSDERIIELGVILIEEHPEEDLAKMAMAEIYISRGFYKEAEELLLSLYYGGNENQELAEQIISVAGFSEDYERVIEIGEKFIGTYKESVIIYYFTGVAFHMNGDADKALEMLHDALNGQRADNEFLVHVYSYLGDIYNDIGDFLNSDKYFDIAIELDNTNAVTLNNYAYYLSIREENLETALEYSSIAVKNEPQNSSFLDTYAWILYKLERFEEAVKYIELAYKYSNSQSVEILKHYGAILLKLGDISEAKRMLLRAKELTGEEEEIEELQIILKNADY